MRFHSLFALLFGLVSLGAYATALQDFDKLERQAADLHMLEVPSGDGQVTASNPTSFTDYSPAGFAVTMAIHRERLRQLAAIDRASLPHPAQVTYDVIKWDSERVLDREAYPLLQFPYTPYEFLFRGPNHTLEDFQFGSDADADAYLRLAKLYSAALATIEQQLLAQETGGIYIQRDVAAKIRKQIGAYAKPAVRSFAWPDDVRLAKVSQRKRHTLRQALTTLIEKDINNSLGRLSERFDDAYQAKAPARYGLAQYPGGKEYYKALIRYRLALDRTPEQLFAEAQTALDRIESDLRALRAEMGDSGPRESFDRRLAADPRFTAKTPADVERVYLDYMTRIDPLMPKLFCRPAPYGYGVRRAAPEQEAALTFGLATTETKPVMKGMYYYNGTHLDQRSLLPAQALIYHELAPGHYWQGAMASISKSMTLYPRRNNAFAESWGDFAQLLAYEQGVFQTPAERYGRRLFNAMFHARALADIGVNYFGYDFDWALRVLTRYTFESELQNRASLARDTTDWPAQILPYSSGSQEILRMRERVRFALGDKFSEPRFYDTVLSQGSVAFPVLERHLDWFIEQERAGGAAGVCSN